MSTNHPAPCPNEADLEASVHSAIKKAFPFADIEIRHQVRFKFQIGRAMVEIDGGQAWVKEGRADIVLSHKGRPLAVVELKRKGFGLHDEDRLQGLSYARMLDPIAPLVVVTNGETTKKYSTYNGQEWDTGSDSEKQLNKLIDNACLLAADDTRQAAQILMGRVCDVWSSVVEQSTAEALESLTGELQNIHLPFAQDFLIPRQATKAVIEALERSCFVILEGEPLIGKSNVLREVITTTRNTTSFTALYVEDGGGGYFQCLADALSRTLGWSLTVEEARTWLQRLTPDQNMKLVILIDQYRSASETSKRELENLVGIAQRGGFSVVVAMDDALVDRVINSQSARAQSLLGRLSERVMVCPLQDEEFRQAVVTAKHFGVTMMEGSFRSDDYRRPWILRSVICSALNKRKLAEPLVVEAPPLLGIDFINYVREAYKAADLKHHFHELASATLEDYLRAGRSDAMEIEAAKVFLLRREALKDLSDESRQYLSDHGAIRLAVHEEQPVIRIGFYEMLVSELSSIIAIRLEQQVKSGVESAMEWLINVAEVLPMGEVIAARAIVMLIRSGVDPIPLYRELLAQTPIVGTSSPRTRFVIKTIDLPLDEKASLNGPANGDQAYYNDNILPWITLSHVLTAHPLSNEGIGLFPQLYMLMEVAKAVVVLRRPGNTTAAYELFSAEMKDGTFVAAWNVGIIEPVTYAIFNTFRRYPKFGEAWMTTLEWMDSVHLLARTYTVLIELIRLGGPQGRWARHAADNVVCPLLINHPNFPSENVSFRMISTAD
ncbi:type I restriction endonuclease [Pseudomonas sp. BF-R-05]|uniref:type I restriction endonuclease n=1 Tax=Pseudomonas sp. BF-R-05 TaxID=2832364 RepID=UPI001CBEFBD2|nr:type I restriction enzyme HsdR N-terminal domain-containing protein [Pseudomonas sp. BF-R-05]